MNESYAVFAERELVQRRAYAKAQMLLDQMPYDELRRHRSNLQHLNNLAYDWINAEIARRHTGSTE